MRRAKVATPILLPHSPSFRKQLLASYAEADGQYPRFGGPTKGGEGCLKACGHVWRLGLPFKKGRIGTLSPNLVTL